MTLKQIDKELAKALSKIGITLTQEMYNLYLKTGLIDFNRQDYLRLVTESTVEGMISSTELGLTGSGLVLVGHEVVSDYYLWTNYKAGTLAQRLKDSSYDAQKIMEKTVKQHIKNKTSWNRLSKALQKGNVSVADLPKHLTELNKLATDIIGNPLATKAQQNKLKSLLKKSKKEVEKLAKGGAPTVQLKNAYKKVIKAVEKGNVAGLKNHMDYAMQKKALYNNQRIARTELARADSQAFERSLKENPHIEMVKIILSDRHNIIDECDFITQADLYGRGKGVYPKDRYPVKPFHPNCACDQVMVTVKLNGARFSNERAEEYFSKLPKRKRKAMLQGGFIKDWKKDLKGYDGELNKPPKPLPKRLVKIKGSLWL